MLNFDFCLLRNTRFAVSVINSISSLFHFVFFTFFWSGIPGFVIKFHILPLFFSASWELSLFLLCICVVNRSFNLRYPNLLFFFSHLSFLCLQRHIRFLFLFYKSLFFILTKSDLYSLLSYFISLQPNVTKDNEDNRKTVVP